ncbi:DUF4145 domain-containing protein [Streptomyces sp. NPDC006012]|uniref:DUF4145 domain-containing protein n=1 Tax=Streptomyces sp. NPDC006012 TaxID=3364739 RepID=UPI0036973EE6
MAWNDKHSFRDCPWCGLRNTRLTVAHTEQEFSTRTGAARYWATLGCPSCGGATLLEHSNPHDESDTVFLSVPTGLEESVGIKHLPKDVEQYLMGAIRVLSIGEPDAAAVQLRRTLEAAAAHFQISEKALVKSIEKLISDGHVTKSFAPALHHIRVIGNLGAHANDERVGQEAAERVLRFTIQLLRNLFEVPGELQMLTHQKVQNQKGN